MTIPENELQELCKIIKNCSNLLKEFAKSITKIIENSITYVFFEYLDSKAFHLAKHSKNKRIRKKNFTKLYKLISALFRPGEKRCFS